MRAPLQAVRALSWPALLLACAPSSPPSDGATSRDGASVHADAGARGVDGAVSELDSSVRGRPDAALDAERPRDASPDASDSDASVGDAALPRDAGPVSCTCEALPECTLAGCDGERCAPIAAPDGARCGPAGERRCVAGACSYGVCGDGYREPGPSPAREACDDGNLSGGDACAPDCTPSVLTVSAPAGEDAIPGDVAVHASGATLFVWSETTPAGERVLARLANPGGAFVAPPITLATGLVGTPPEPRAAALVSGFVVVWAGADADESGVRYARVSTTGAASPSSLANQFELGRQVAPVVAPSPTGFVVAWTDRSGAATAGAPRVRLRELDASGVPVADEHGVTAGSLEPALAAAGGEVLLAWTQLPSMPFGRPTVQAQRIGVAPDVTPFELGPGAAPDAAPLRSGDFAVAWVSRETDADGDVVTRLVRAAGDPLSGAPMNAHPAPDAQLAPSSSATRADELLVAFEDGGARRGLGVHRVGATAPLPELPALRALVAGGAQGDVRLRRAPRGIWFLWSDASASAHRSFAAYLLPVD